MVNIFFFLIFLIYYKYLDVSDIIQWINYERYTLLEYYPALVVANLVEMLQDEALVIFHKEIVCTLFQLFYSLGPKSAQYVNQVLFFFFC